jgi:hypothetical protein
MPPFRHTRPAAPRPRASPNRFSLCSRLVYDQRMEIQPAWIATCVTAVGLLISVSMNIRQIREARRAKRSFQADLVGAWTVRIIPEKDPYPRVIIRVKNGSSLPIYSVKLEVRAGTRGTYIRFLGTMGPSEIRELEVYVVAVPRADELIPRLNFADSAQVSWLRESTGELILLKSGRSADFRADRGAFDNDPFFDRNISYEEEHGRHVGE